MTELKQAILVVEKDFKDYFTTERALRKTNLNNPIYRCVNGQDVLDYLNKEGKFSDLDPDQQTALILLDLNLPDMHGTEVLAKIKEDERFNHIPVFALILDSQTDEVDHYIELGADACLEKPIFLGHIMDQIVEFREYSISIEIEPR